MNRQVLRTAMSGRARPRRDHQIVLSRATTTNLSHRAASIRRLRRRVATTGRLFCSTNGCASFLEVDPEARLATCPICGYRRFLS